MQLENDFMKSLQAEVNFELCNFSALKILQPNLVRFVTSCCVSHTFHSFKVTDGEAEAIRPLPWYPENLAWHSNFSRMQLRKNQTLERYIILCVVNYIQNYLEEN